MFTSLTLVDQGFHRPFIVDANRKPEIISLLSFQMRRSRKIFKVWGRSNVITEIHRNELEKYIFGIISNNKCKPLSLYCNPDHIHILVGLHPTVSVSDLTRDIKSGSSKFINQKK